MNLSGQRKRAGTVWQKPGWGKTVKNKLPTVEGSIPFLRPEVSVPIDTAEGYVLKVLGSHPVLSHSGLLRNGISYLCVLP